LTAVDLRKQRQITRTSRVYRNMFDLEGQKCRFDVVSVVLMGKKAPKVRLHRHFWNESKFKKKNWTGDLENQN
jgi:Holliday junction resolvase-like predicted endonuclease